MLHGYSGLYVLLAHAGKGLTEDEMAKQNGGGQHTQPEKAKKEERNLRRNEAVNESSQTLGTDGHRIK